MKKRVDRIINETTNGARQLVDCLMNNLKSDAAPTTATADSGGNSSASMEDADGKEKVDHDEEGAIKKEKERGVSSPATTITAWGAVDIKALIRHVESESKNLLAKAELLQWKKEVVDISILLTPVTTINDDFATRPTAELFEGNKEDVKLLDVLKEDRINNLSSNRRRSSRGKRASSAGTGGGLESAESVDDMTLSEEERIVLERIRRRLLHLIQRAPHDNFKAKAVPTSLVTGKQQQHQLHPNSNNNNNVNSRARK